MNTNTIADNEKRSPETILREMAKRLKASREACDGLTFRLVSFATIDKIVEELIEEYEHI